MRKLTCLNGFWDFACGTGTLDQLPVVWDDVPIHVPSPFNINSFAKGYPKNVGGEEIHVSGGDYRLYPEYPLAWEEAQSGFYRRSIFVAEESRGQRLFLRFEGVAFHSVFYLNGQKIGEETEAFLPIEIEITEVVRYGADNELMVGARTAGGVHYYDAQGKKRTDWPEGSFWGGHIAGIWQDVWLEERPAAHIAELFAYSDTDKRTLFIRCASDGADGAERAREGDGGLDWSLKFSLSDWGGGPSEDAPQGMVSPGNERPLEVTSGDDHTYAWHYHDGDINLWHMDQPALYMLQARLYIGGVLADETSIRIGFRSFKVDGNRFLLNGRPIKLRNDSWHYMGYSVQTPAYARTYYRMAKDANVNIIRLHAQPFPSFFYDIADEMGMLLISESAIWASHCNFSYNNAFFENGKKHLKRLIIRDRNHPSVIMWSAENECVMAWKVCGSSYIRDMEDLSEKLYDLTQVIEPLDPSRIISCDGSGDLNGKLPVYSLHYPGYEPPSGHGNKPVTIGEMGSMYYSTPDHIGMETGERVLSSMKGRLAAVGLDAYQNLTGQRRWAAQVCVFNLIWYGLQPLPFEDALLTYDDYTTPGIKPSRITPYIRTLNAGAQENLPEYVPNPVYHYTKRAFMPVCCMAERVPTTGWRGETAAFPVTLFNDQSEDQILTLRAEFTSCGNGMNIDEKTYTVAACGYTEDEITLSVPETPGSYEIVLTLLDADGNIICRDTWPFSVYDRQALEMQWEALGVIRAAHAQQADTKIPSIIYPPQAPYDSYMKPHTVRRVFTHLSPDALTFNAPRDAFCFDEYLPFNAQPLFFNGAGQPVAVSLLEAGVPHILSGVAFDAEDPSVWNLHIQLGNYLREHTARKPQPAYLYAAPNGEAALMLDELRCAYEIIDRERLTALMKQKQEHLLIVEGGHGYDWLKMIHGRNFEQVLVLQAEKTPNAFMHLFEVTDKNAFHLQAGNDAGYLGVYGNALYGLRAGHEAPLGARLLRYHQNNDGILLGLPDTDWRQWNHNAEYLKTAAALKGEQSDHALWAALSCHGYAGTLIYFNQLTMHTQNRKAMHLQARILSSLGCMMAPSVKNEWEDYLHAGLYRQKVTGMLHRAAVEEEKHTQVNPGLNQMEQGRVWRFAGEDSPISSGWLALFVYSPQDRTDFLLNPDTVDMQVQAEKEITCRLNGSSLSAGKEFTATSLPFTAGWNTLLFYCAEKQPFPDIRFNRINGQKLDLAFGLYDAPLKEISLQNAVISSKAQPEQVGDAVRGPSKYWHSHADQRDGIDLLITFPASIHCRAFYFNGTTEDNPGGVFTPRRFKVWAGDSPDEMALVYESLPEEQMSYREGRVFIRWDAPPARCFMFVLTENALKPWIVSDLTFLA